MAIITVAPQRVRSEIQAFVEPNLVDAVAAYNAYEVTKAADGTKTWTVRLAMTVWDGQYWNVVAEAYYPEMNDDRTGQVPILP